MDLLRVGSWYDSEREAHFLLGLWILIDVFPPAEATASVVISTYQIYYN